MPGCVLYPTRLLRRGRPADVVGVATITMHPHLTTAPPHLTTRSPTKVRTYKHTSIQPYKAVAAAVARAEAWKVAFSFLGQRHGGAHPLLVRGESRRFDAARGERREHLGSRGEMRQFKSPVQCTGLTRAGRRCSITSEASRVHDDQGRNVNEPLLLGARHCRFHL